jgi:hypothetical protein
MTIFSTLSLRFLGHPGTQGCIRPVQGGREVRAAPTGPGRASARRARYQARSAAGATHLAQFHVSVDFQQRRK